MHKILVVVDMQNDFITGSLGTKEAQAIVPNVVAKIKQEAKAGTFIACTQDTHHNDYINTNEADTFLFITAFVANRDGKLNPLFGKQFVKYGINMTQLMIFPIEKPPLGMML